MSFRIRTGSIVLAAMLALLPADSFSQGRSSKPAAGQSRNTRLREIQTKIIEAQRLLRQHPRKAVDLLERLNERFPDEPLVLVRLGHAYQTVEVVDSAMMMYQRCLQKDRVNLEAGKALGMLYFSLGENEKAEAHFRRFLRTSGQSLAAYRMVGTAMSEVGLYNLALTILREGRDRGDAHYRLTLYIADQEKAIGNYEMALTEYLNYVERFPQSYHPAKQKIIQLFEDSGEAPEFGGRWEPLIALAEERSLQTRKARREIMDILSQIYMKRGFLEKALEAALEADQHERSDGQTLHALAGGLFDGYLGQTADQKRRYFELCIRALDAYIERHPRTIHAPRATYERASLYADAARGYIHGFDAEERIQMYEAAMKDLDHVFRKYPGSEEASLAALEKGDLLFEVRKKPREALAAYKEGLKQSRAERHTFVEKIGRIHLALGEYDLARRHFTKFIRSSNKALREAGVYYIGVLLGFSGEYEAAKDTLTSLAEKNPDSKYTNDAIELAWIIEEGRQRDERMLDHFMQATKAEFARDSAAVVEHLDRIVERGPGAVLHARALYKLGGVYARMGDFEQALVRFRKFLEEYPTHDLRPDVHRAIAIVYEHGLGEQDLALKEYEDILIKYPKYLLLDEIRADINRLRPEGDQGK